MKQIAKTVIRDFHTKVVGVTYGNADGSSRQEYIKKLKPNEDLVLRPVPTAEYPDAIGVFTIDGKQLGHVSAGIAAEIKNNYPTNYMQVTVADVTGGGDKNYGCNIHIVIYEEKENTEKIVETRKRANVKICNFCGTENSYNAVKCNSCGSNDFQFKCGNCGSLFSKGLYCPHCGVKAGQEPRVCPVCKAEYYTNACPTCGYVPSVSSAATVSGNTAPQPVQQKRKTWLWVLGWIFIFPLPLTLILAKKQNINKGLKYGIIVAAWLIYILIAISGLASRESRATAEHSYYQKETEVIADVEVTEVSTEVPTEAPTEPPTDLPTEAPTEAPTKVPTEAPTPISIYEYTDNVQAGSTAYVTIQGAPNTVYSIHVYYSSGESNAEGLEPKTSNENGFVTWEWEVGTKTSKGEHSITVAGGGTSERVIFNVN